VAGGGVACRQRAAAWRSDRLIAIGNTAVWLVAAYALARIGAVFLLLDPLEAPAFRDAIVRRLRLVAVLGDGPAAQLGTVPLLQPQPAWLDPGPAAADPRLRADGGDAPMMICLSSGTTRAPKAMFRTHRDHAASSLADRPRSVEGAEDRLLALTSFRFSYGLCEAMQTLDGGACVPGVSQLAQPRPSDPGASPSPSG
jgi:acyl-CoA synthetase (AMP-forming)/AMP-acid ligase II